MGKRKLNKEKVVQEKRVLVVRPSKDGNPGIKKIMTETERDEYDRRTGS